MQYKLFCFFGRHDWSGSDNNVCSKCGKVAIGLPKFVNPPMPPYIKKSDCLSGRLQIHEVKNKLPPPPIFEEVEVEEVD